MKKEVILIGMSFGLLVACGGEQTGEQVDRVKVSTMEVGQAAESDWSQRYVGVVESGTSTNVSFMGMGTLSRICVNEGEIVRKGQLIAEMDKTQAESQLRSAEAQMKQAEDAYARMRQLHESQSLSEIKWVETQTALQQAEAQVTAARKNLADCVLYAPVTGYVGSKSMENGETVLPAMPVVSLLSIQEVKVRLSVPEKEIALIGEDSPATITVEALGGATFTGGKIEKGVEADGTTHAYTLKVHVANPEQRLLPGMVCEVALRLSSGAEPAQLYVPITAVHSRADGTRFVWRVKEGKAVRQEVRTGRTRGDRIGLLAGVEPGWTLVTEGHQKLSEGSEVME